MPTAYFDTETSAYWNDAVDHCDEKQALPVQIAILLDDEQGRTLVAMAAVLQRTGWARRSTPFRIEPRCVDIHGITERHCDEYGEPPILVMTRVRQLIQQATLVVAHNIDFDVKVLDGAFAAMALPPLTWPEQFCTMRESTNVCRIPNNRASGYKWPKLAEAFRYFSSRELPNAHNALVDTQACRAVHRGLLRARLHPSPGDG